MSAPIDDLLYGGDDSGDEDDLNSVPMSSFSAPLPSTGALPMAVPPNVAPLGAPAAVLGPPAGVAGLSAPPPMSTASVSAPVATMAASAPPAAAARPLSATSTASAAPAKQSGSGHQMFQQMFALLKQMLPPEQYAALHSEMRNGNGNDIKSIVDIIKRIAGDAIFASVIQKMDLTRNHSAAAGSLGIVKAEPSAVTSATPAVAAARAMPATGSVPPAASPLVAAAVPAANVVAAPNAAQQRPTLVAANAPSAIASVGPIKAEPLAPPSSIQAPAATVSTTASPPPITTGTPVEAAPGASAAIAAASGSSKNDTLEKIQFAKKLLFHASTCQLPPGVCQVKRCDDVRRVFKHSVSCGGARGCSHCKQLKALVEYHAKECVVPVGDHCKIPFCDGIRRNNAAARARAASTGSSSSTPTTSSAAAPASGTPSSASGAMSDDDEDNTPLASAVAKVKKPTKAKSPKASPAAATSGPVIAANKKKTPVTTTSKPSTPGTGSSTSPGPSSGTVTAPGAAASGAAAAAKPKAAAPTLTQAQEYGRLLQLILHVEKCKTSNCPVGEDCAESKALLRQVNSSDAPARAQTYKKVYAHYKVCVAKNNTQNCPMCKIGLLPLTPSATPSSASSVPTTSTGGTSMSVATTVATSPALVPATSPSVTALKRTNSSAASPRSPSKKPRMTAKGGKASGPGDALGVQSSGGFSGDQPSSDLAQATRNDLRREEDVLTHTMIDLNAERRIMMDGSRRKVMPERLACKKEEWMQNDLFNNQKLTQHMEMIAKKNGVSLGAGPAAVATTQVMAYALQEYLKQVIEEMVEAAKVRGDVSAQTLDQLVKRDLGPAAPQRELTSTDILRVSCDDSFARLRHDDLTLRSKLLDEAKREELAEKERAKKRKKVDRVKLQAQEEKDEAEMDMEELALKDLKERLLHEDKDGLAGVEGRVNESIAFKYQRRVDNEVTIEDATYWLQNQKPYINPRLFVRAEAARVVTKSLL